MEIDDKKIEQTLNNLNSAIGKISRIDLWLPEAIDNAMTGHRGTMDHVDMGRMRKERMEEEKMQAEMNSLHDQIEESQKQTREIRKQTQYLMYAFAFAFLGFLLDIILKISPSFFELMSKKIFL